MLKLVDGFFRVRADVVSQHHQAQQVHMGHMGLDLVLSHVQQIQLMSIVNHANCHGHHPEAVAAELISDLKSIQKDDTSYQLSQCTFREQQLRHHVCQIQPSTGLT